MIASTLGEIAAAVGGRVDPVYRDVVVTGDAFVDSRAPAPGGLFAAVPGERVDGHDYAERAVAAGAAAALVARPVAVPSVLVPDVPAALASLARVMLGRADGLTVVGVTGSQGKTSTKDMLAAVLGSAGETVAARASQNNEIGVPLTALRVGPATRYLVAEMGARGKGHIAYLAGIVAPRVGVVLNVGSAHLGEFGSRDAIAAAKGELVEALPPNGWAVLNADDPRVAAMASRTTAQVVTFGASPDADLRVTGVGLDDAARPSLRLTWRGHTAESTLRYVGTHHAMNAAAAAAAAVAVGLPLDDVAAALRDAVPASRWRMEVAAGRAGTLVVNDAYNANPDSMWAALQALADIAGRRDRARMVAVLGEMRELGAATERAHAAVGRQAAALGIDLLVTVGPDACPTADAASKVDGWRGRAYRADDPADALAFLEGELREHDIVLVKASRAAGLERLAAALLPGGASGVHRDGDR